MDVDRLRARLSGVRRERGTDAVGSPEDGRRNGRTVVGPAAGVRVASCVPDDSGEGTMGLFDKFKRGRDNAPVDLDERSPRLGVKYRDLMVMDHSAPSAPPPPWWPARGGATPPRDRTPGRRRTAGRAALGPPGGRR